MTVSNKTYVFIDGFNLYYGCLKKSKYKWLNIGKLCALLLPQNEINKIYYFTAIVKSRPNDPQAHIRQLTFIRALETIPDFQIVRGRFLSHDVFMPLAKSKTKKTKYVNVIKTEEKGSDVNLATFLMFHASRNDFDTAVIISNDSDLVKPIDFVTKFYSKKVGIINPHKRLSVELSKSATFYKPIREGVLKACQFPAIMKDAKGNFYKPKDW